MTNNGLVNTQQQQQQQQHEYENLKFLTDLGFELATSGAAVREGFWH